MLNDLEFGISCKFYLNQCNIFALKDVLKITRSFKFKTSLTWSNEDGGISNVGKYPLVYLVNIDMI